MFKNCTSIEEAKKVYRELSKKNHPDCGGSEESMKKINQEYEQYLNDFIAGRVSDFVADKEYDINSEPFSNILNKIIHFNIEIEVIGFWIYVRECWTAEQKTTLSGLGFWYSRKHKAFVFSGSKKRKIRTKMTTEDIRQKHGSTTVRDFEELKKIA